MTTGLTIGELAALVDMTPRNIRAHQSRGVLQPPRVEGRVAYYDAHHVARLLLVRNLQAQGYSLRAIRRLVHTPATYAAVVGAARPATSTWDLPETVPVAAELAALSEIRPGLTDELVEVGLLVRDPGGEYGISPVVAGIGAQLLRGGVPLELVMDVLLEAGRVAVGLGRRYAQSVQGGPEPAGDEPDPADEPAAGPGRAAQRRDAFGRTDPPTHPLQPQDAVRIGLVLFSAGFELAFARGAALAGAPPWGEPDDETQPEEESDAEA